MNKNIIIGIIVVILLLCVAGVITYFALNNETKKDDSSNETTDNDESQSSEDVKVGDGKVLVVYYSATNNTKEVALEIADELDADTFEITPKDKYTEADLNYNDNSSRVSKEHDDESLRDVELTNTKVPNWDNYDTVLIGYPIWWGVAAWPVDTFVKANDFSGKTVIPFCTSASSGLGESDELLAKEAGTGNWLAGHRFSSNASDDEIEAWTESLEK